ncbi:tripartite tricarboxylate transporter substrate binding protein [Halobellus sp. Atlit-31R]|nr:tripartite tricarboxylate transporter substrate binding protein [Halobellus sp. Atlit-31R]
MRAAGTASVAATVGLAGCTGGNDNGGSGGDGGSGGSDYPESGSTVEYIVPFSEGGGTDTYARQIMGKVSEILDFNLKVTNVPGGASLRGTSQIVTADADGYTMGGFNPPSTPLSYLVFQSDFDLESVEGVCTYATTPYTIIANADAEVTGMDDLIDRYNDGEFEALGGCQSQGGLNHVAALVMQDSLEFGWTNYVGYDGCAPAGQAVASGEIPAAIGSDLAIEGVVNSGRADVISVLLSNGSTVFPDAPSLTDDGYDNIDYIGGLNRAMWMPPGTDRANVDVMAGAIEEAMASDELQQWSEESGNGLTFGGPDAANDLLQNSLEQIPQRVDIEAIREVSS